MRGEVHDVQSAALSRRHSKVDPDSLEPKPTEVWGPVTLAGGEEIVVSGALLSTSSGEHWVDPESVKVRPGLGEEAPVVAVRVEREAHDAERAGVLDLGVGLGRRERVVLGASGAEHELAQPLRWSTTPAGVCGAKR